MFMREAVRPSAHDTLGTGRGMLLWVTQHPTREPCRIVSSSTGHSRNPQKGLKIYQFLGVGDPVHDLKTSLGEITRKHIPQPKNSLGFPSNGKERLLPALLGAGLPCMLVYWIWQHKDEGGGGDKCNFILIFACLRWICCTSVLRSPQISSFKNFYIDHMLGLKGKKTPPPVFTIRLISSQPLRCPPLSVAGWEEQGQWGEPHQCEPLREGRVSHPLPSATVPSPLLPHLLPAKSIA